MKIDPHPHIMSLLAFHFSDHKLWIMMEKCTENLNEYMRNVNPNFDEQFELMAQSANAVAHMHNENPPLVHRDLTPGNLLIKLERKKAMVMVADFGVSKLIDVNTYMTSAVGTTFFAAPEVCMEKPYTFRVDVFSLGLLFLAMLQYKHGEDLVPRGSMCDCIYF